MSDASKESIPDIDTIDSTKGHAHNVDAGADMATTHSKVDAIVDALTSATPDAQLDACMNSLVDGGLGKDDFDLKVDCTVKVNMEYDMQMGAVIGHDTLVIMSRLMIPYLQMYVPKVQLLMKIWNLTCKMVLQLAMMHLLMGRLMIP